MRYQSIFKQINSTQTIFYAWFNALHTRIDIALCNLSEEKSKILIDNIYSEILCFENMINRFNPESELSRLNRIASTEPVKTAPDLIDILSKCVEYNRLTSGAFDITIQSKNYKKGLINHLIIDKINSQVYFKNENLQLDLNGFIKGYVLDIVRFMIEDSGCKDALVNFGNSSVCGMGNHPNGEGWKVTIPCSEVEFVVLMDNCLTTSGNASNHKHIISPNTATYSQSDNYCSVITDNATDGEVLSTVLCVSDKEYHQSFCKALNGKYVNLKYI
ncbi:FAD:protein FMN transferase [Paludibacter sp.]